MLSFHALIISYPALFFGLDLWVHYSPTGTAIRKRKAGQVHVEDPKAQEKKAIIEQAYEHAEAAGLPIWCQDEAGPYQAIPQPGENWHPAGKPTLQPHEYVRGGTAKLLTLFHPATGLVRAKGVLSAPNTVLHPWVQGELQNVLDQLDKQPPTVRVPLPEDHPLLLTQAGSGGGPTKALNLSLLSVSS